MRLEIECLVLLWYFLCLLGSYKLDCQHAYWREIRFSRITQLKILISLKNPTGCYTSVNFHYCSRYYNNKCLEKVSIFLTKYCSRNQRPRKHLRARCITVYAAKYIRLPKKPDSHWPSLSFTPSGCSLKSFGSTFLEIRFSCIQSCWTI